MYVTKDARKYRMRTNLAASNLARIMARHQLDKIRHWIRVTSFSKGYGEGINQWSLVDDFVKAINQHKEMSVTTSDFICIDEITSCWYVLGGDWIIFGLPKNFSIDWKML